MTDQPRWPKGTPVGPSGHGPGGGRFRDDDPADAAEAGAGWIDRVIRRLSTDWGRMDRDELRIAIDQKLEPLGQLTGGQVAEVHLFAIGRGDFAVRKKFGPSDTGRMSIADARATHDASTAVARHEIAVGLVAEAIGAPYPPVIQDPNDETAVYMQYVRPKATDKGLVIMPRDRDALATDDALALGLLDLLAVNGDRHTGNWIATPTGRIVGIDGSEAFADDGVQYDDQGVAKPPSLRLPGFTLRYTKISPVLMRTTWKDNDLSPGDIAAARARLDALDEEFHRLGMDDNYRAMMARFEAIARHATGTRRRLPI